MSADSSIVSWSTRMSNNNAISDLMKLRNDILGNKKDMTLDRPHVEADGKPRGGIHFERLGQKGVKDTWCYSLSLTHQSQRGIVGPAAGGKIYGDGMTENEKMRKRITEVSRLSIITIGLDSRAPWHRLPPALPWNPSIYLRHPNFYQFWMKMPKLTTYQELVFPRMLHIQLSS